MYSQNMDRPIVLGMNGSAVLTGRSSKMTSQFILSFFSLCVKNRDLFFEL
jgi:hypothetical protein